MKQKTTLEKDAFENHEDGTRLRKRPRKSTDDTASKRRQNDSPILYKYIHRRINLQLENDKKRKNGTLGANAHVLEEYLYDIAYTPQESNNPEITANYVTLYTNEWMTHKATLGKYLVIIPLIILTILTINYGCSLLVKKKRAHGHQML